MKIKKIVFATLLTFFLAGCSIKSGDNSSSSSGGSSESSSGHEEHISDRFSFNQIEYDLKPGAKRSDIQGAPWINANLPGMVEKIEKPSLKDDFYTAVNYEDLLANKNEGSLDYGDTVVFDTFDEIFRSSSSNGNAKLFGRARSLIEEGCTGEVGAYLNGIEINDFLSSKEMFNSLHSFFEIEKIENKYYITFVDGYFVGDTNIATLALGDSDTVTVKDQLTKSLFTAFGVSYLNSDISEIDDFDYYTCGASYQTYYQYGDSWQEYTYNQTGPTYFDNALQDYGLTHGETIYISKPAKETLDVFSYYSSGTIRKALLSRLAFQMRYLCGLEKYRPISSTIYNLGWFPSESDLTYYSDYDALILMTRNAFVRASERAYLERASSTEMKSQISSVIEQIINKYKQMANTYDWLDDETKEGVYKKMNNMSYLSCYSDLVKAYPLIDETNLNSLSLLDIFRRFAKWEADLFHENLIEKNYLWGVMPVYTVNAFYMPSMNSFVIINGVLGGIPMNGTFEEILGSIGVVIGHEISHSIDSSGAQYNEYGQYVNWWSAQSKQKFDQKVNKMIGFFNQINLYDDVYIDGDTVDGEVTADMGGVHVALEIAKSTPNFNYDKFFKAYAKLWLSQAYSPAGIERMLTNEHPYPYIRVNTVVSQFDEFRNTYNIKPGDRMYIADDQRVAIW